jgi:hypothetical protein
MASGRANLKGSGEQDGGKYLKGVRSQESVVRRKKRASHFCRGLEFAQIEGKNHGLGVCEPERLRLSGEQDGGKYWKGVRSQ